MEQVDEPDDLFVINELQNDPQNKLLLPHKDNKPPVNTVMQSFIERDETMIEHLKLSNIKENGDSV